MVNKTDKVILYAFVEKHTDNPKKGLDDLQLELKRVENKSQKPQPTKRRYYLPRIPILVKAIEELQKHFINNKEQ